jgi:hypothetical protein
VSIINQDVSYDLTNDPEWKYPHQYVDTEHIYSGEIGRIAGCRFVETSEAKIFSPTWLSTGSKNLTVKTASTSSTTLAVVEALTSADATALAGVKVMIDGTEHTISSATAGTAGNASLTLSAAATIAKDKVISPEGAGADGRDVYVTLVLGADAYGVTEVSGGGLQHIVKQLGSAGTGDPLDQRATAGWKATKVAERLVEEYMVRIESTSTFNDGEAN